MDLFSPPCALFFLFPLQPKPFFLLLAPPRETGRFVLLPALPALFFREPAPLAAIGVFSLSRLPFPDVRKVK